MTARMKRRGNDVVGKVASRLTMGREWPLNDGGAVSAPALPTIQTTYHTSVTLSIAMYGEHDKKPRIYETNLCPVRVRRTQKDVGSAPGSAGARVHAAVQG